MFRTNLLKKTCGNQGFTLIELLVVISIISLLSSVVLASLNTARNKAKVGAGKQFAHSLHNALGLDLVGEWKFEQTGELISYDTSGYGNNGVQVNGAAQVPVTTCELGLGGCAQFQAGVNDYVTIVNSPVLQIVGDLTIAMWVKPSNITANSQGLVHKNVNNEYSIVQNISGALTFYHGDGVGESVTTAPQVVQDNVWTHIVVVRYLVAKEIVWYVNGVVIGKNSFAKTPTVSASDARIGTRNNATFEYKGLIDEVRIYASTITAQEVGKIYAEGRVTHPLAEAK